MQQIDFFYNISYSNDDETIPIFSHQVLFPNLEIWTHRIYCHIAVFFFKIWVNCIRSSFFLLHVGHTFLLGTRYSDVLKATFKDRKGAKIPLQMGCYGLGEMDSVFIPYKWRARRISGISPVRIIRQISHLPFWPFLYEE